MKCQRDFDTLTLLKMRHMKHVTLILLLTHHRLNISKNKYQKKKPVSLFCLQNIILLKPTSETYVVKPNILEETTSMNLLKTCKY